MVCQPSPFVVAGVGRCRQEKARTPLMDGSGRQGHLTRLGRDGRPRAGVHGGVRVQPVTAQQKPQPQRPRGAWRGVASSAGRIMSCLVTSRSQPDRLFGLVVKECASRVEDPGFDSRLRRGDVSGSSHTSDLKLALQWLPCLAPDVIESALGLVGRVSVYCNWVR